MFEIEICSFFKREKKEEKSEWVRKVGGSRTNLERKTHAQNISYEIF